MLLGPFHLLFLGFFTSQVKNLEKILTDFLKCYFSVALVFSSAQLFGFFDERGIKTNKQTIKTDLKKTFNITLVFPHDLDDLTATDLQRAHCLLYNDHRGVCKIYSDNAVCTESAPWC